MSYAVKLKHKYDVVLVYDESRIEVHFAFRPIPGSGATGLLVQLDQDYPSVVLEAYDPGDVLEETEDYAIVSFDPDDTDLLTKLIYNLEVSWNFDTVELVEELRKYYEKTLNMTVRVIHEPKPSAEAMQNQSQIKPQASN